jgi:hypothetical protein
MTIAMVIVGSLVARQMLNARSSPQEPPQPVEIPNETAAASTTQSFKNSAELEAFLKSDDPTAKVLRTYMLASTSVASTSLLK